MYACMRTCPAINQYQSIDRPVDAVSIARRLTSRRSTSPIQQEPQPEPQPWARWGLWPGRGLRAGRAAAARVAPRAEPLRGHHVRAFGLCCHRRTLGTLYCLWSGVFVGSVGGWRHRWEDKCLGLIDPRWPTDPRPSESLPNTTNLTQGR